MAEDTLTQTAVIRALPHPQVLGGAAWAGASWGAPGRASIWEEEQRRFASAAWLDCTASPVNVVHNLWSFHLNKARLQDLCPLLPVTRLFWLFLVVLFLFWGLLLEAS